MDSNKQFIRDMPMAKRIAWLYHCSNFFRTSVDKLINEAIERLEEVKIGSLAELVSNAPDSSAGMVALPNVEAQRWEGLAPKAGSAADVTSPDIRCSAWFSSVGLGSAIPPEFINWLFFNPHQITELYGDEKGCSDKVCFIAVKIPIDQKTFSELYRKWLSADLSRRV